MIVTRFERVLLGLDRASAEKKTAIIATDPMDNTLDKELDLFFFPPLETRLRSLGLETALSEVTGVLTIQM